MGKGSKTVGKAVGYSVHRKKSSAKRQKTKTTGKTIRRTNPHEAELARLIGERDKAIEQQAATAEVLKIINSSAGDLGPVFDSIVSNAARICEASLANLLVVDGTEIKMAAMYGAPEAFGKSMRNDPVAPAVGPAGTVISTKRPVHIADLSADERCQATRVVKLAGARSLLGVPLLMHGQAVGAILIYRQEVRLFSDRQIGLLENFAAQAVIAIENARLLHELRQRTDDLSKALEQQTATSEVLKVISASPGELEPVFNTMLAKATDLCGASYGALWLCEGDAFRTAAFYGALPSAYVEQWRLGTVFRLGPDVPAVRAARTGVPVQEADLKATKAYASGEPLFVTGVDIAGIRTILAVPMLKDGKTIGIIAIYRKEVLPFEGKQIALVQNFAAQAVIAIENARLLGELRESLRRQTATADVLKIISSSPGDLDRVFKAILESATEICGAKFATLYLRSADEFYAKAFHNAPPAFVAAREGKVLHPDPESTLGRAARTKEVAQVLDATKGEAYRRGDPFVVAGADLGGYRTIISIPMLKDDQLIGVISIYRQEVLPFTDKQVELLQNFAAQAVIAMENARLLNELRQRTHDLSESLEQQTATSEVLRIIAASSGDLAPVFDAMLRNATEICNAKFASFFRFENGAPQLLASLNVPSALTEFLRRGIPRVSPQNAFRRMIESRQQVHIDDYRVDQAYLEGDPMAVAGVELGGIRSLLIVPMTKDNEIVGALGIFRQEVRPFSQKQIQLVSNFAAQAVIAIENARLLTQLRQRTDDLSESLDQQTAISEILRVISSSPSDVQPVLEAVAHNAARICEATVVDVVMVEADEHLRVLACVGDLERPRELVALNRATVMGRAILDGVPVHVADLLNAPDEFAFGRELARKFGHRSILAVPLMREGKALGTILVRRAELRPFEDKHIALLQTFADQAAIAIENTRLFNELRKRTTDLTESLAQQTATSDILRVISGSPTDTQPVFDAIVQSGLNLFAGSAIVVSLADGKESRLVAAAAADPAHVEALRRRFPVPLNRNYMHSVAVLERRMVDIPDAEQAPPDLLMGAKNFLKTGNRAITTMPMMRGDVAIGAISVIRRAAGPLSDKQKELLRTFADQAVIAIENTRLFKELRERTDDLTESLAQQTATADVLKVISRSTFDLEPVLETLLESAARLCDGHISWIFQSDGRVLRWSASYGHTPEVHARVREFFKPLEIPINRGSVVGRAASEGGMVHISDVLADPEYTWGGAQKIGGYRACLGAPLLRDGKVVGVLFVAKNVPQPFSDKQIELVKTFADQALIAIENTRLFNELRESLQQQTATADVLKVISRSTFDLQTVLDTLVESAARLCDADMGSINAQRGQEFRQIASFGYSDEFNAYMEQHSIPGGRGSAVGRAVQEKRIIQIHDVMNDAEYTFAEAARIGGIRTLLAVPMMREGTPVGIFALQRTTVRPFTQKQIDLVETFADQAVIAIENVRLFESVEARTRELAQSVEDLQTAQDRLVQTQKLASLGQLTAGIAHEIKNPLNFVNNFSSLSTELMEELQELLQRVQFNEASRAEIDELIVTLRSNLGKIEQHGKRADSIVKNMLLHSREGSGEHRLMDINALVEESLNLAYHGARAERQGFNITLERSFDPAAGEVDLFPQEITRVLLNLISNGFYAATRRKAEAGREGYEPTLATSTKSLGDRVEIRIRDNGTGIPSQVKDKIFNPFFTTKPPGEGTGLGLSLSHDIVVKQHAGLIEVDTKPGEFTEFRIVLPRAAASIAKTGERA